MKLAEALIKMKDMKGKLAQVHRKIVEDQVFERLDDNMEVPTHVDDLIAEYINLSDDLAALKASVADTNTRHCLTAKIHRVEALRSVISQLDSLSHNKQKRLELKRLSYDGPATPVSVFATYDVGNLASTLENLRAEIRSLDLELQKLNWEIDLEE